MGIATYEKSNSFLYAGLGMALSGLYSFTYTNFSRIFNNQDDCHTNGETSPNSADGEA